MQSRGSENQFESIDLDSEDLTFSSDEESTNTDLINSILNFDPEESKLQHILTKPSTARFVHISFKICNSF